MTCWFATARTTISWPSTTIERFVLWCVRLWASAADRIAQTPDETVAMLEAADRITTARLDHSGYTDPSTDRPGVLITIDEDQHVFDGDPHATALAERITATGGRAGVGLVVTTRGTNLAYYTRRSAEPSAGATTGRPRVRRHPPTHLRSGLQVVKLRHGGHLA